MTLIYTDRSRIEDAERCLRLRYYRYHYDGIGIDTDSLSIQRELGTAVHCGIECAAKGKDASCAVNIAVAHLDAIFAATPPTESQQHEAQEAKWLAEALVRAWTRVRLPELLAEFELLGIELRRKVDGALLIHNLKTVAEANDIWREQWSYDMQTLTEPLATEAHYGDRCSGVVIEGIVKGKRLEYPEGSGIRTHNSPLTQCWYEEGDPPVKRPDWKSLREYAYVDSEGKSRRLGRGYRKRSVADVYPGGIAAWVAQLPVEVVHDSFIVLPAILRSAYQIERWKGQVLPREVGIGRRAQSSNNCKLDLLDTTFYLDEAFPMSSAHGNCLRPGRCAYLDICWGSAGADPYGTGFRKRVPNHPDELVALGKGAV
jgi:hypothetical protein